MLLKYKYPEIYLITYLASTMLAKTDITYLRFPRIHVYNIRTSECQHTFKVDSNESNLKTPGKR